jgi:hypothetical protein
MNARVSIGVILAAGALLAADRAVQAAVIAHWSIDETSGTNAADSTGTLNANGVLKTAVASGGVDLDASGVFSSGVVLDGNAGSYLTTPYIDGIQTSSYTIAAWINQRDTGINTVFSDWRNLWAFRVWAQNGQLGFDQRSNNPYGNSMGGLYGSGVATDTWQHVAFTWDRDAKTGKVYLNGRLLGQATSTRSDVDMVDNNRDYHIGWKEDGGDTFNGGMDELWVVNEALSQTQLDNLMYYNRTATARRFALAHLSFDEPGGTSVADSQRPGSPSTVINPLASDQNLDAPGAFNASGSLASGGLRLSNGADYVGVPRVDISQSSLTIAAFIDPTAIGNGDEIFGDWSNPWQFRVYLNANGELRAELRRDGPNPNNGNVITLVSPAGTIDTTAGFQHVAMTWDRAADEAHLYVDGVDVATATASGSVLDLKDGLHPEYQVGWKRDDAAGKFEGLLDELWVFNTALSPSEINDLRLTNVNPVAVPEPSSLALAAWGLLGLLLWRRRRRSA